VAHEIKFYHPAGFLLKGNRWLVKQKFLEMARFSRIHFGLLMLLACWTCSTCAHSLEQNKLQILAEKFVRKYLFTTLLFSHFTFFFKGSCRGES
jgi:hypothetical protein